MPRRNITRRRLLQGLTATPLVLPALGRTGIRGGARADPDHAGADRGRHEGRQGHPSTRRWTCRSPSRWPRRSRPSIRASRSRSSARAPSACSSASARSTAATSTRVDVVNSSDAAHFIVWKREGLLAPLRARGRGARTFRPSTRTPTACSPPGASIFSAIAYNTKLVKPEDAPKSFADLLDPKWSGKIVKAHPGYCGTIMTATHQIARDLGWEYFEKLAKQKVMQVQSATEPPKKLALGERADHGRRQRLPVPAARRSGEPVEIVYPTEGTPLISRPDAASSRPRPIPTRRGCC